MKKATKSEVTIKSKVTIVTGTPGTGKTTIAKKYAEKNKAVYIDVNEVIKKGKIAKNYDKKRQARIIDIKKLNRVLLKIIKEAHKKRVSLVIDSHLSHYLPAKYVDLCIVTKTALKKLKLRLQRRGYSKAKIRENMDCEIFDICLMEAKEIYPKVRIINT